MAFRRWLFAACVGGALVLHVGLVAAQAGGAGAGAKPSTWDQYMADLKPNLETGATGLAIDHKFWDKYSGMSVEWTGKMKSCTAAKDGKVSCEITMPAHTVKVKTGPESGTVIDTIIVSAESPEASRWQALAAGVPVRFSAKTSATVMALPAKEKGGSPFVGIILTEGKLLGGK